MRPMLFVSRAQIRRMSLLLRHAKTSLKFDKSSCVGCGMHFSIAGSLRSRCIKRSSLPAAFDDATCDLVVHDHEHRHRHGASYRTAHSYCVMHSPYGVTTRRTRLADTAPIDRNTDNAAFAWSRLWIHTDDPSSDGARLNDRDDVATPGKMNPRTGRPRANALRERSVPQHPGPAARPGS